ncbi:MAG TPA: hypothetical protein VGF18_04210, partial [Candidatus Tumulicola sp.]|jgi:hypothetical protein
MTVTTLPRELADAEAVLFSSLAPLVDLSTLTSARDGYDYHVKVPAAKLHDVMKRLSDIEYDIEQTHNVRLRVLPVPAEE